MATRQSKTQKQKLILMKLLLAERVIFLIVITAFAINYSSQLHQIRSALEDAGIVKSGEGGMFSDGLFASAATSDKNKEPYDAGYAGSIEIINVSRPEDRTMPEVLERLRNLGSDNTAIKAVAENSSLYPDELLCALANNPEMADYAAGYPEGISGSGSGGAEKALTKDEKLQKIPLLLQWDPRWGYETYGNSTIGLSGCGPTVLSMALISLTKDEGLTPDVIASYSMENGYYWNGSGTAWALFEDLPAKYDIKVSKPSLSESEMKAAIDAGKLLVLTMRPGDFTINGHFILIYGYNDDGFLVNDPNCVARSRRTWTFAELKGQVKGIWAYKI